MCSHESCNACYKAVQDTFPNAEIPFLIFFVTNDYVQIFVLNQFNMSTTHMFGNYAQLFLVLTFLNLFPLVF